jgi:hypothetical protein
MTAYVGQKRKDGKYPVKFCYPISGRIINKLIPADQIDEKLKDFMGTVYGYCKKR